MARIMNSGISLGSWLEHFKQMSVPKQRLQFFRNALVCCANFQAFGTLLFAIYGFVIHCSTSTFKSFVNTVDKSNHEVAMVTQLCPLPF